MAGFWESLVCTARSASTTQMLLLGSRAPRFDTGAAMGALGILPVDLCSDIHRAIVFVRLVLD